MGIIRLLLAVSVVFAHSTSLFGLNFVGGRFAVQCFYMISGFYMALVLSEKYVGAGTYSVFMKSRLLRLYPVYIVVVIATIACQYTFPSTFRPPFMVPVHPVPVARTVAAENTLQLWHRYDHIMTPLERLYFVGTNMTTLGQESTVLFSVDRRTGDWRSDWRGPEDIEAYRFLFVPQAWSIGVELMFYMIAPFLVRRKLPVIFAVIGASLAVRLVLANFGYKDDPWNYRFFPSELMFFMTGTLAYRAYKYIEKKDNIPGWLTMGWWIATVVVILVWSEIPLPVGIRVLGLIGLVAIAIPLVFLRTKNYKWDRYIGELSYPVYISHLLVVSFLTGMGYAQGCAAVLITLVVSVGLYHMVDRPVDAARHRWVARAKARARAHAATLASTLPKLTRSEREA